MHTGRERKNALDGLILLYPVILRLFSRCVPEEWAAAVGGLLFWGVVLGCIRLRGERWRFGLCAPGRADPLLLLPAAVLPALNLMSAGHAGLSVEGLLRQAVVLLCSVLWEELLFRGVLQRRLLAVFSPAAAILVQGLLFGCAHWLNLETYARPAYALTQCITAIGVGFWLGVIAWQSGSVLPCAAAHACINLTALLAEAGKAPVKLTAGRGLVLAAAGALYFAAGLAAIHRQRTREERKT